MAARLCEFHQLEDLVVARGIVHGDHRLGLDARACHDLHCTLWEAAVGSLAGEHHAIRTVEHGVGDIRALGSSRPWVGYHRLEHLSGDNARLARVAAFGDHHLLLAEHLLRWNLHAQITTGHHHAIRLRKNFIELVQALLVLNLGDDLNVLASLAQRLANETQIIRRLDEGRRNEVDLLRHSEVLKVVDIFGLEHWQIDLDVRQVHVLTLADALSVHNLTHDRF
mmetsp:Transcript_52938/g.105197  ORF Transcript_52938/g.105197 Transcript_52938/m.105197 type:complete len:224 (-) Transcript_52938:485-1156(-)